MINCHLLKCPHYLLLTQTPVSRDIISSSSSTLTVIKVIMSSFLVFFVVTACSALPQYPGYFNSLPQFPQQFPGFQFPQRPLPAWFNPNQLIGGPASLPPWLKPQPQPHPQPQPQPQPQADAPNENTENASIVRGLRFFFVSS